MELRALLMSNDLLTVRTPNNALWQTIIQGRQYRFTYKVKVDLKTETIFVVLALHEAHLCSHRELSGFLAVAAPLLGLSNIEVNARLGGGFLIMNTGRLVFFGSSSDLGPYCYEYLHRVEGAIKQAFCVGQVDYYTDCFNVDSRVSFCDGKQMQAILESMK